MCQFHKHFTLITYSHNKLSCCILETLHGSLYEMNDQTYFATAVNYNRKMFMKLTTGVYDTKL
jgi:hypothetical protein